MHEDNAESVANDYVRAAGKVADQRYSLPIDELTWLVEHATRLGSLRLELLIALQSALPRADGETRDAELKGVLTDLIIMQNRLAGRERVLQEHLGQVADSPGLNRVNVDEASVSAGILEILQAVGHVREIAVGQPSRDATS